MNGLLQDARYALRMWARHPGFTGVAVLTLALGIGANTTIFSVVNATVLAPLPFPESDRLVTIWKGRTAAPAQRNIVSMDDYRLWLERNDTLEALAVFDSAGRGYNLSGDGEPERVSGVRVTASFFDVLGVPPLIGRTFLLAEEDPGRDAVVVLSHGLWTRRYGADPSIVGREIRIDGEPRTVVGVMPPRMRFQFFSDRRELWVPAGWTEGDRSGDSNSFIAMGRLKPGTSLEAARTQLASVGPAMAGPGEAYAEWTVRVEGIEFGTGDVRGTLGLLLGVVGFVLLIACANVANLMLARAATRQREMAVRTALGAGRGRILRQLLTESMLLGAAGGAAGLLLAAWGTSMLTPMLPGGIRFMPLRPVEGIDIDRTVFVFTGAISLLCGLVFGMAPALATLRGDVAQPLKAGGRGATGGRGRLRHFLVSAEVALTMVTLAGAGAMVLSVARLLDVDPGLETDNVLVMSMSLPQANPYYSPPDNLLFCEQLRREVGSLPGVEAASAVAHLPLGGGSAGRSYVIEGRPDPGRGNEPGASYSVACPGMLRALGIPLVAGRDFTDRDTVGAPEVAIVSETLVRRDWPGQDPIGQRFKLGGVESDAPWLTVVGVFRDIRQFGLQNEPPPLFYRPYSQAGWPTMAVVVRTASAPGTFASAVKAALARIDPEQPVSGIRTMDEVLGASLAARRFPMLLLSGFALLALILASVGIAGVVGYSVVQRTQEIGVRMALGARPADVQRLLVRHSMRWTLLGVGAGLVASMVLLRILRTMLYEVEPTDPLVLVVVSLVLTGVALTASYLPTRRAARIDPVAALRHE